MPTIERIRLGDLAARLGCELHGDPDIEITGVAGMEHAGPTELTFLANPKYAPKVKHTRAAAILVSDSHWRSRSPPAWYRQIHITILRGPWRSSISRLSSEPGHSSAWRAWRQRLRSAKDASIGAFAVVGEHVRIGRNAVLHPHVVIYEGAEIGDDFCAHSHAVVREYCRIGDRVILQNGVVVGGDGFGFAKTRRRHAFQDRAIRRDRDRGRCGDPDR